MRKEFEYVTVQPVRDKGDRFFTALMKKEKEND